MSDLWHSWGTTPKQKAREKEYNHWYYENHKEDILKNQRRRYGKDKGRDANPNNNMDGVWSNVHKWKDGYGGLPNAATGSQVTRKPLQLGPGAVYNPNAQIHSTLGSAHPVQPSTQTNLQNSTNSFSSGSHQSSYGNSLTQQVTNSPNTYDRMKQKVEKLAASAGKTFLSSGILTSAKALGAALCKKVLKSTGKWGD